jgi:dihydrofolate reductase
MRKLIYGLNLTLDGCCDHVHGVPNAEVHDYFTEIISGCDLAVYGRKTFDLMVPYWPDVAANPGGRDASAVAFAKAFDELEKMVFSRTLKDVTAGRSWVNDGNLLSEIHRLKQMPGRNICLGGVDLPEQLIPHGVIDEYCFVIQPCIAGAEGRRLNVAGLAGQLELRLIERRVFESGHVALRYRMQMQR